jgi:CheY-like chemotaxis protein
MPGMDGVALYRKLKDLEAGTVAIIVTAYAGNATLSDALEPVPGRLSRSQSTFPRF